MGLLTGVFEGTLPGDARREILPRFADRARVGHFGRVRHAFDVEEIASDAQSGYRDAARIPAIRLRAKPGGPAPWFEAIELDVDDQGGLRYRIQLGRSRARRLGAITLVGLTAAVVAILLSWSSGSVLFGIPILLAAVFMIPQAISRLDARWKKEAIAALRSELEGARIDAALEPTGVNIGVAQDLLARLEARSVALTDDERERILACDDAAVLAQWMQNAQVATSATELFEAPRVRVDASSTEDAADATDDACAPSGPGVTTLDRGTKA